MKRRQVKHTRDKSTASTDNRWQAKLRKENRILKKFSLRIGNSLVFKIKIKTVFERKDQIMFFFKYTLTRINLK